MSSGHLLSLVQVLEPFFISCLLKSIILLFSSGIDLLEVPGAPFLISVKLVRASELVFVLLRVLALIKSVSGLEAELSVEVVEGRVTNEVALVFEIGIGH